MSNANDFNERTRDHNAALLAEHGSMLLGHRNLLLIDCDAVGADPEAFTADQRQNFDAVVEELRMSAARLFFLSEQLGRPMRPFERIALRPDAAERS